MRMSDKWVELVGCSSARLPGDLVLEILWCVPATGLVRLKSVCRSWRTLISSPEFAREHLERSTAALLASDARIAYAGQFSHLRRIGFLPLHSLFHNPSSPAAKVVSSYDIVGSCHGLLCLFDTVSKSRVMLWNPCTGSHRNG
ncbi:probable F-box protein At5g47300 [Arachis hypogaea]|uniref:probable F-box protein At5g47300 n=1 Tax=Arachis hypogaea TaxID=3818 RepID=UPI003B2120AB